MDLKESFLASLSDEQLGFFCAHEYNENLADMLQDEINVIQYKLFVKWKEHEKRNATQNPVPSSSQPDFTDKISQLFEMFAERIEAKMEQKIKALEESYSEKLANIEIKIEQSGQQIKKLEGSYSGKLANIEIKIEQSGQQIKKLEESYSEKLANIEIKIEQSGQQIKKLEGSYSGKLASIEQQIAQVIERQQQHSDRLVEVTERQQQHSDKLVEIQSSISDVKQKFDKSEQYLIKLEGSISQQFAYIKQKIEESEPHLTEKSDQLTEKVFDCIKNSSDLKILNERVEVIGNKTLTIPTITVEEATEWFEEIRKELVNKRYECITEKRVNKRYECITEKRVKKIVGIMKKFEDNKYIVDNGIDILRIMTRNSDMTIHYITNTHGGIEYLMKLFKNSYRNDDIYRILIRIVECKETQKKLMKSEYLSLIFERLSNKQDPYSISYYSLILSRLLDFSEDSFPVNLTKNMIESKIMERIPKSSTDYILSFILPQDYSWYLERLINGTKAQKYLCAYIAVCATNLSVSKKQIKYAGAIPILERVLSDVNTDSFVKNKVNEALRKLEM